MATASPKIPHPRAACRACSLRTWWRGLPSDLVKKEPPLLLRTSAKIAAVHLKPHQPDLAPKRWAPARALSSRQPNPLQSPACHFSSGAAGWMLHGTEHGSTPPALPPAVRVLLLTDHRHPAAGARGFIFRVTLSAN